MRVTDDGVPPHSVLVDVEVEVIPRGEQGGCSTTLGSGGLLLLLAALRGRRRA